MKTRSTNILRKDFCGRGTYRHPTGRGRHPIGRGRMWQGNIGTLLDVSFHKGYEHFSKYHNMETKRVENQSKICVDAPHRVPSTHQVTRPHLVYSESREPAKCRSSLGGSESTFFPRLTAAKNCKLKSKLKCGTRQHTEVYLHPRLQGYSWCTAEAGRHENREH